MISSANSVIMRAVNSYLTQKQVKRKGRSSLNKSAFEKRKKWYDYSCSEARKTFEAAAKNLSRYPKDPVVRGKYIKCKKSSIKLWSRRKKEHFVKIFVKRNNDWRIRSLKNSGTWLKNSGQRRTKICQIG